MGPVATGPAPHSCPAVECCSMGLGFPPRRMGHMQRLHFAQCGWAVSGGRRLPRYIHPPWPARCPGRVPAACCPAPMTPRYRRGSCLLRTRCSSEAWESKRC